MGIDPHKKNKKFEVEHHYGRQSTMRVDQFFTMYNIPFPCRPIFFHSPSTSFFLDFVLADKPSRIL